ncbi:tumor necrosis factor receptor superfamily member 11B-like [Denticeps clupeoides]|uniref:TNFR-Cys domain-containing protein n=1 Tax=Denticeps clupeoides TaxID=299321 RepID=A0AAY4E7X2_9TELE|nr:tumor necrosis factor receptor superfamily member 11B [Denticeps clupeoides]
MRLCTLFAMSFALALHPTAPQLHQYWHLDPATSQHVLCDQCPPGTAVQHHCGAHGPTVCSPCPERHFTEHWHWGESCQYCTSVCKEKQLVKRECNSTHDQMCECVPGYYLMVEFCVPHAPCPPGLGASALGTPESDTVCEKCPSGFYSSTLSPTDRCIPHRDCSQLGLKMLQPGTSARDVVCENEALDCSGHHTQCHTDTTLCEEAIFQFLSSPRLASVPVEWLLESLPGRKVDWKNVERLRKTCSPQQQILHLLRLWREQNKDQEKLSRLIQGVSHCERKVQRCAGLKNLTLEDLTMVMGSLPGVRVGEDEVRTLVHTCPSQQHILQLLHLWKRRNSEQDVGKALIQGLRRLRGMGAPRRLLKSLKRISRVICVSSMHRLYEKIFINMIQDSTCFKSKAYND